MSSSRPVVLVWTKSEQQSTWWIGRRARQLAMKMTPTRSWIQISWRRMICFPSDWSSRATAALFCFVVGVVSIESVRRFSFLPVVSGYLLK